MLRQDDVIALVTEDRLPAEDRSPMNAAPAGVPHA